LAIINWDHPHHFKRNGKKMIARLSHGVVKKQGKKCGRK
jgi:hypothetical protein